MIRRARKIRIYVRNKQRYNPAETKVREFLFLDVEDFVGTTIADVKEDIRKQTKSSVRIDELFLNNLPLADDRSVAHYNLQHETILETTSNPFLVSCLYIKVAEVKQEQEGHPSNNEIQKWTNKSIPKKYTLIGLLLNSKKEFVKQPPHFPTLDDFVTYLGGLNKKGATMHPEYTLKDMRAFEREYRQDFIGRYNDPLAAFLDNYALRLGYLEPEEVDQPGGRMGTHQVAVNNIRNQQGHQQNNGRQTQGRVCEDCELSAAVLYCTDCPGGIALCEQCSQLLHAGAKRRRHNLQDIKQAPKNHKPYVPRAFLAPFALTVAMYRSLTEGQLSLTEEEIKKRAQPLTDTDLIDKQNGRYVGGFDCMENMLIAKGLVKKEAARVPTYALTESGHVLGEKLYTFYVTFNNFLLHHQFPKISTTFINRVAGNRKICLIIDEHERDKDRLLAYASDKHIDAQVRFLPAGDYVWILSPPLYNVNERYLGNDPGNEMVLPFVVERKSWEDFENSINSNRFQRQVNNMLGSGVKNCFYLMEGSIAALKSNSSQHHQQHLKAQVQKLIAEYGFYVSHTSSWMKSAQWLLWFSQFVIQGCNKGLFKNDCISYSEYASRVARQAGAAASCLTFRNVEKVTHRWTSHLFIDHIFRDKQGESTLLDAVRQDLHVTNRKKHLLVVQDLQQYNKKRQSALNKCCDLVCSNKQNAQVIVSDKIGPAIHNMVHYDIASFWQLYIQVTIGVYVVRTENDEDTARIQQKFMTGPQGPVPKIQPSKNKKATPAKQVHPIKINQSVNKDTQKTLTIEGQGHDVNNFKKMAGIKKSNIHSFSSVESSDFTQQRSHVDNAHATHMMDDALFDSAPLIHKDENVDKNRKNKTSVGIPLNMIQPFSGEGYCLGGRSDLDSWNIPEREVKTEVHSDINGRGDFERRPVDGAKENADTEHQHHGFHGFDLKEGDFVDPKDEDTILQELLTKSEQEVAPVNNEDEMYRLAVELSMKEQRMLPQVIEKKETMKDKPLKSKDEMYRKAIEMSMKDTTGKQSATDTNNGVHESEEDQLKLALELSMNESFSTTNQCLMDQDLEAAVEISKHETGRERHLSSNTYESSDTGMKRKLCDSYESERSLEAVQCGVSLSEDEQINIAIELSKKKTCESFKFHSSYVPLTKENSEKEVEDNRDLLSGDMVTAHDEDELLKIAIERSKIENYSPRKRFKSGSESQSKGMLGKRSYDVEAINETEVILIDSQSQDMEDESNEETLEVSNELSDKLNCENVNFARNQTFQHYLNKGALSLCSNPEKSLPKSEKLCNKTCDSHSRFSHNKISDRYLKQTSFSYNEMNNASKRHHKNDFVPGKDVKSKIIEEVKMGFVDTVTHLQWDDTENSVKNDGNIPNSEQEQITFALKRGMVKNIIVSNSCEVNNKSTSENYLDVGYDIDETDDSDIEDCVPPSPDKLPKSRLSLTPVLSQGQRLSQLKQRDDKMISNTTQCNKEELSDKNFPESNKSQKTSERFSKWGQPVKEQPEKIFDLKTSLFYDSEANSSDSDGDDCTNDDNNNGSCAKAEDQRCDNTNIGSNCRIIPGNILIRPSNKSQKHEESDDIKVSPKLLKLKKSDRAQNDMRDSQHDVDYIYGDTDRSTCKYEMETDIDDDLHDIDYQPNSQNIDSHTDSDDSEMNSDMDKDDSNKDGDVDLESLPLIGRPRTVRYKKVKNATERLIQEKRNPSVVVHGKQSGADITIKTEKGLEVNHSKSSNAIIGWSTIDRDENYAQLVQNEPNNEEIQRNGNMFEHQLNQVGYNSVTYNDAQIAKELHERLNREADVLVKNETDPDIVSINSSKTAEELDEAYAKQLDLVLNGEKKERSEQTQGLNTLHGSSNRPDREKGGHQSNVEELGGVDEEGFAEIQRKEFEKIERWKKVILDDEQLARQLQELEEVQTCQTDKPRNNVGAGTSATARNSDDEDVGFKKMVAMHKASREKALAQLNEYRQLQMERFSVSRSQITDTRHEATSSIHLTTHAEGGRPTNHTQNHSVVQIDDDDIPDLLNTHPNSTRQYVDLSQDPTSSHVTNLDQSQVPLLSHVTNLDQSQVPFTSQTTQVDQSQAKNSNITCGNCGEKGHNRTFYLCKKYHTAEETARREAKMEKSRQQKEEKKKVEEDTLNLLANQHHVLEEMTEQIQTEMNTIQRRLKQKTSELEKQVSNRMKKLENSKKKRK